MGLAIKNNIMASNAARHLGKSFGALANSVERLSSGLRINSAKDDAAGLAVRELMRADIAVLQQGSRNASDGISMLQTMEGAMAVMDDNLIRMKELAEQAATGSYSEGQRTIMNSEFSEMADEIERIANSTSFNGITMLNSGTGTVDIHVGTTEVISVDKEDMTKSGLGINTGVEVWQTTFTDTVASSTADYLTIGVDNAILDVQFDNGSGASEDQLSITFASDGGGGGTTATYTLAEVAAMINSESEAIGFNASGVDDSYTMAEVVADTAGNYQLQLSSRDEGAAVVYGVRDDDTTAGATFDFAGVAGASITGASSAATGTTLDAGDISSTSVTGGLNILTEDDAISALETVSSAIQTKDTARAAFGYKMNRLESTQSVLNIQAENLMTSESRISDVDVSTEMATMTRNQVLSQAGVAMLSQANTMPQMALSLLR